MVDLETPGVADGLVVVGGVRDGGVAVFESHLTCEDGAVVTGEAAEMAVGSGGCERTLLG